MPGRGPSMDCVVIVDEDEPRRWRPIITVIVAGAVLAGLVSWWLVRETLSPCEREARLDDGRRRAQICLESYRQYKRPRDLLLAAKGYMSAGALDDAAKLAGELRS